MTAGEGEGPGPENERFSEAEVEAAVARLGESEAFAEAEGLISRSVPGLQRILAGALGAGGWFGESHEAELLKAATNPDSDERLASVRTLLAEEARVGMMVGVAVGWALRAELIPEAARAEPGEATGQGEGTEQGETAAPTEQRADGEGSSEQSTDE